MQKGRRKENLTHNSGAHGGVSNCVIKYVTGSRDAAVEARSRHTSRGARHGEEKKTHETKSNKTNRNNKKQGFYVCIICNREARAQLDLHSIVLAPAELVQLSPLVPF